MVGPNLSHLFFLGRFPAHCLTMASHLTAMLITFAIPKMFPRMAQTEVSDSLNGKSED